MTVLKQLTEPDHPSVVIQRRPKKGMEQAYAAWAEGIYQVMAMQPGFRSYQAIPPIEGHQRDWFYIFTFEDAETLRTWLQSDTRARWQALSEPLTEGPGHARVVSGMEHLFGLPSPEEADPPAVWKIALLTEFGLAPTVYVVTLILLSTAFYGRLPLWAQVILSTAICVSTMTWVVMPLLTRLVRRWLYPASSRHEG